MSNVGKTRYWPNVIATKCHLERYRCQALCLLAKCLSAKCLSAKCLSAKCLSAKCLFAKCLSAKCLSAKCLFAKCLFAKCLSAKCLLAKYLSAKCLSNKKMKPLQCHKLNITTSFTYKYSTRLNILDISKRSSLFVGISLKMNKEAMASWKGDATLSIMTVRTTSLRIGLGLIATTSITTLSIKIPSILCHYVDCRHAKHVMQDGIMLSTTFFYCYAECSDAERSYHECIASFNISI